WRCRSWAPGPARASGRRPARRYGFRGCRARDADGCRGATPPPWPAACARPRPLLRAVRPARWPAARGRRRAWAPATSAWGGAGASRLSGRECCRCYRIGPPRPRRIAAFAHRCAHARIAMYEIAWQVLAWLFLAALLAGFIDAIAGGGGMVTIPAMLLAGIPPLQVLGTNKLQAVFGSGAASWSYARGGHVELRGQWPMVVAAALGAAGGALLATVLPTD